MSTHDRGVRRLLPILMILAGLGCRERAPGAPSWVDLDASPPEAGSASGGGGRSAVPRRDAGPPDSGEAMPSSCRATLLVIFDRSGSMTDEWEPRLPKWQAASLALEEALDPYAARLNVGAIFFPSGPRPPDACAPVAPIGDQVPFGPGEGFFDRFREELSSRGVGGSTPLDPAFARADEAMIATEVDAVIVLTDGQPTCVGELDAWTYAGQWHADGTDTWVIGLPGIDDPGVLDAVAVAGGTVRHVPVDDRVTLATELADIAEGSYSQACP